MVEVVRKSCFPILEVDRRENMYLSMPVKAVSAGILDSRGYLIFWFQGFMTCPYCKLFESNTAFFQEYLLQG